MRTVGRATMVVLAVSGLVSAAAGVGMADTKGGGAKAAGGDGAVLVFEQQNVAQEGRQNSTCGTPDGVSLLGGPGDAHCWTRDQSKALFSKVRNGRAEAVGGNGTAVLGQQNAAQEGRQNSYCGNPEASDLLAGTDADCVALDRSFSKEAITSGRGAKAEGENAEVALQQSVAQEGRQNSNCANPHSVRAVGAVKARCVSWDKSFSEKTSTAGGGAKAEGGNDVTGVFQQSVAQEGRQNSNCGNPVTTNINAGTDAGCVSWDKSFSRKTSTAGGGAKAEGGNGMTGVFQQNLAQEGRQNSGCGNSNGAVVDASAEARCALTDKSASASTTTRRGGAEAVGGDDGAGSVVQLNTAQEGRQNNNCGNPNTVPGGEPEATCVSVDESAGKKTFTSGRGAKAAGGDGSDAVFQQNTAQEGRQNNSCGNPNTVTLSASVKARCTLVDKSVSVNTTTRGGGAVAVGGDSTAALFQQNLAQEGRQNNNCGNPNDGALSGPSEATCGSVDESVEIDHPGKKRHKKDHGSKSHRKSHR